MTPEKDDGAAVAVAVTARAWRVILNTSRRHADIICQKYAYSRVVPCPPKTDLVSSRVISSVITLIFHGLSAFLSLT